MALDMTSEQTDRALDVLDFQECPTCRVKPGMPTLCSSCLHNRTTISKLKEALNKKTEQDNMWSVFHRLWSKAVDSDDYNKEEWLKLEKLILNLTKLCK